MTEIENIRQAVAEWMGWRMATVIIEGQYIGIYWIDGKDYEKYLIDDYTPDTNAQQADELWKELERWDYQVQVMPPCRRYDGTTGVTLWKYDEDDDEFYDVAWASETDWKIALARAVAKLLKEKNDKPKKNRRT